MTTARIQAIERATNRSWDDWLTFMQRIGAEDLDHHTIATHLLTELRGMVDNIGWWAQATAVAYEQHVGRRVPGQQPDGTFRISLSRSTTMGMSDLMQAWTAFADTDPDVGSLTVAPPRVSGTEKRITWRTKGQEQSTVTVISEPKKNGTAALIIQHGGLPSPDAANDARQTWMGVCDRFAARHQP